MNLQKLEKGRKLEHPPKETHLEPTCESTWIVFIQTFSLFCTSNIVLNSFTLEGKQESNIHFD